MERKNAIKELFEQNYRFAIGVSNEVLKDLYNSNIKDSKAYYIILKREDAKKYHLNVGNTGYPKVVEYNMNDVEIDWFKNHRQLFKTSVSNSDGIVYEIKGRTFKEYYKD